ncbi:MAG: response regulator transcription factor [Phaeodactylibacter sp.]|nr:response regulator transcription factor [Phaeodactylibacter sp.]
MTKIRCLLVDDEPPAIALLERYAGMIDQLEVVGKSHSAVQAFDRLKDTPVDLIFLDIQMPVLNGIDFIKTLTHPPAVILTTAYREYALEGYDLDIIDYLLKPIAFDRFLKAVDRYRNRLAPPVSPIDENLTPAKDHIYCNVNRTQHRLRFADIHYVESLKDYVRVHTQSGTLVVKGNIGSFMEELPAEQFVRIHRSFAVALQAVTAFNQTEVQVQGTSLPLGQSYREAFLKRLS